MGVVSGGLDFGLGWWRLGKVEPVHPPESKMLQSPTNSVVPKGCLRWVAMTALAGVIVGGVVAWKFIDESAQLLTSAGQWLQSVGDGMHSRSVTDTFRERLVQVTSTEGDILELAVVEMDETFSRADSRSLLGDMVYLGTTMSEIRLPVVYRYHLKLSDPWTIEIVRDECRVVAPPIRPSLPPAIRTEAMEKKSESGWLRFNAAKNLADLEKGLTPRLELRAADIRRIDMAREASRKAVEKFVRRWIIDNQPNRDQLRVVVRFPDEVTGGGSPQATPTATPKMEAMP